VSGLLQNLCALQRTLNGRLAERRRRHSPIPAVKSAWLATLEASAQRQRQAVQERPRSDARSASGAALQDSKGCRSSRQLDRLSVLSYPSQRAWPTGSSSPASYTEIIAAMGVAITTRPSRQRRRGPPMGTGAPYVALRRCFFCRCVDRGGSRI
jgi:hypothetical protein